MSPDFLSYSPIIMRSGHSVSCSADPSFRNSGFIHKPKSLPQGLFEHFSRIGLTIFSVVPGIIVLFTTTKWYVSFLSSACPISFAAFLMYCRFMLPSGLFGVPTVMKVMSVFRTASRWFSVHLRFLFFTAFCRGSFRFGSWMGAFPLFIKAILFLSMSEARTLKPLLANAIAVHKPT